MRSWVGVFFAGALLGACAQHTVSIDTQRPGTNDGDEVGVDPYLEPPPEFEANAEIDAGSLDVPEHPKAPIEAGTTPTGADAGPADVPDAAAPPPEQCGALGAGSLVIDELLIKSVDGAGDAAEWVELENPNDCVLDVPAGLRVVSPRGAALDMATADAPFSVPPHGHFLAGGSGAPTDVMLPTLRWSAVDALKNSGDVVRIELGELLVDSVLYPSFTNLTAARSVAFPSDCPAEARAAFTNWSGSFTVTGSLTATPFAPNDDVTCPAP